MDKNESLFNRPPVPKQKTSNAAPFYNSILLYDESYIYCGKLNFSYEEFYDVTMQYGDESCEFRTGDTVAMINLWIDLKTDFSFEMTKKLNDL